MLVCVLLVCVLFVVGVSERRVWNALVAPRCACVEAS